MKNPFSFLKAAPHVEPIKDPELIKSTYKRYRFRNLYGMLVGYAVYYFVRKNFAIIMASEAFRDELGFGYKDLGIILTVFSLLYGFGKFANGMLADRTNARYFMAFGLLCSGVVNIVFGMSSALLVFAMFWIINAWVQSMGMPASVRLLTHWFSPTELGTFWGIQSTAHQVGGAGIMVLAAYLVSNYGWRSGFYVPAFIAILVAFFLIDRLRDTPQSMGLPPVEEYRGEAHIADEHEDQAQSTKEILFRHVLPNKYVWIMCIANIFVYIVRIGIMDWAPMFLVEARGSSLGAAGLKTAAFELAGIVGTIGMGWTSDKIFKGRRGPLATISMFLLAGSIAALWIIPIGNHLLEASVLIASGVLVYGPQLLVPVAAADFASKKAAATATGLTGQFGYIGSALAGIGTGLIVETWGWNGGFAFFVTAAILGAITFSLLGLKRAPQLDKFHNDKDNKRASENLAMAGETAGQGRS